MTTSLAFPLGTLVVLSALPTVFFLNAFITEVVHAIPWKNGPVLNKQEFFSSLFHDQVAYRAVSQNLYVCREELSSLLLLDSRSSLKTRSEAALR